VLVLPLIGDIDQERATEFIRVLLEGITHEHARVVLLDLTGVPLLDTSSCAALLHGIQSARLLGARCTLVGIRPEIAQTLITLGIEFHDVSIAASLQQAISDQLRGKPANGATRSGLATDPGLDDLSNRAQRINGSPRS